MVDQDKTTYASGANQTVSAGFCGVDVGFAAPTAGFSVRVNNVPVGQLPSRSVAERVASQIRQAMPLLEANPNGLIPSLGPAQAAGQVDGQTVFALPALASQEPSSSTDKQAALQATEWVNNLRLAFGGDPLDPVQVQMASQGLGETHQTLRGTASWYGPYFHGRQTATGETFNQHDLTAAHKTLPFGTYLRVHNQLNGKRVIVRINDRGPYIGERSLDLSYAAAQCLSSEQTGVIPYEATILAPGLPQAWRADVVAAAP
ncbi:MAG: septal ring lytic transglycosylase RlpA family protein [Nodosilinea sp.]